MVGTGLVRVTRAAFGSTLRLGPGAPTDWDWGAWEAAAGPALLAVRAGFDIDWEREQIDVARREGRDLLSLRLAEHELLIGPHWTVHGACACAGCAEARERAARGGPAAREFAINRPILGPVPALSALASAIAASLAEHPLAPGELLAAGLRGVRRHRIVRSFACPVCVDGAGSTAAPPPWQPVERRAAEVDCLRGAPSLALDRKAIRARLVDARFGPVLQILRDDRAPFAMSDAVLPDALHMGYGRGLTFDDSEPVAVLESYERLANHPHEGRIVAGRSLRDLGDLALDPSRLGRVTDRQRAHPSCRLLDFDSDTSMDWAWGHRLDGGAPVLVPAEAAYYAYDHLRGTDTTAARDRPSTERRHYLDESSSGCALGSSLEEAALHGLLEHAERDAFQLAWHRRCPLREIRHGSLSSPVARELLAFAHARGFAVHLLVTTYDLGIPSVWGLAVRTDGAWPASVSAAGAHPDPERAVLATLWELIQLVGYGLDVSRDAVEAMVADPWLVVELEDHLRRYTSPALLDRVGEVLGGDILSLDEAFPDWPRRFRHAARGDVTRALRTVEELYAAAGLDEIVVVDGSTRDHLDLGLRAVRTIVPGIVPMCFGQAQQRYAGVPRLAAAIEDARGFALTEDELPLDPHPFP